MYLNKLRIILDCTFKNICGYNLQKKIKQTLNIIKGYKKIICINWIVEN